MKPIKFSSLLFIALSGALQAQAAASSNEPPTLETQCPGMAHYQAAHRHPDPFATIKEDPKVTDQPLRRKLLAMYAKDETAGAAYEVEVDKDEPDPRVVKQLEMVREENLKTIKALVRQYGFPTSEQVGDDGVWAAFTLVQHADGDHAFQTSLIGTLAALFTAKKIPGEIYAYVLDRTLVADGKLQVYGTQFHSVGKELVIRPLQDAEHVDKRRLDADLPSMSDYLCYVRVRSGRSARMPY